MATTKKFLDQAGTTYLWSKIKTQLDTKAAASDVTAINTKLGTLPSGKTSFASWIQNLEENGYDDTEIRGLISANADDIDALETLVGDTAVATQIQTAITALNLASTYAGKSYESKVDTLIGSDTGKSARTIANEELAKQLIPENASEALDTLAEIAAWIQGHPGDVATINSNISTLQTALGDASNPAAGSIRARLNSLETDTHTHSNKELLDTYTQTEANLADAVSKKHSHSNASVLDGITAAKVSAWDAKQDAIPANTYDAYGAAATAKSEVIGTSGDASTASTIYGAKAYADSLAGNYATAAQGDKADSALQDTDVIALTNAEIDTAIANATT